MFPPFNLLLYVFLGPFSPRANGDESMSSLFFGPPYGARLQNWHHSHMMCLVSIFTRLINTQNMLYNTKCCLFYLKLLQHVFTWSFSQNQRIELHVPLFSRLMHRVQLQKHLALLYVPSPLSLLYPKYDSNELSLATSYVSSAQNTFNNMA
jgi:hypothetical protein